MTGMIIVQIAATCVVISTGFLYMCARDLAAIRKATVAQAEQVKVMAWRLKEMEASGKE